MIVRNSKNGQSTDDRLTDRQTDRHIHTQFKEELSTLLEHRHDWSKASAFEGQQDTGYTELFTGRVFRAD